jgi:undecaprenyl diphosphate synthase
MSLPKHLAIIMDGNGRWATARGRSRIFGHIKGARVAKKIITECSNLGLESLTLYAFSSENWLRPEIEVSFLMRLFHRYLEKEAQNLVKQNIRFEVIGDLAKLPKEIIRCIDHVCQVTRACSGLRLVFAVSYGSKQEITGAVQQIAQLVKDNQLDPADINESTVAKYLQTKESQNPDLIIRTSGEKRLSNFLLWQAAYSELYFSETLWPDFSNKHLHDALFDFSKRHRRFGSVDNEQPTSN